MDLHVLYDPPHPTVLKQNGQVDFKSTGNRCGDGLRLIYLSIFTGDIVTNLNPDFYAIRFDNKPATVVMGGLLNYKMRHLSLCHPRGHCANSNPEDRLEL
jgi:hypothetical protein